MTTTQAESAHTVVCWCCGEQRPTGSVVRLGSHPEVEICFGCAHFLQRRAAQRLDEMYPSLGARIREPLRKGRQVVIERGWHRKPVVGSVLRWIGRYLP